MTSATATKDSRTRSQLLKEIEELKSKGVNPRGSRITKLKVSDKGGLSLYGMTYPFPITHYVEHWEVIFANRERIEKFMADNASKFSRKDRS